MEKVLQDWLGGILQDVQLLPRKPFDRCRLLRREAVVHKLLGKDDEDTALQDGHCISHSNVSKGWTNHAIECLM